MTPCGGDIEALGEPLFAEISEGRSLAVLAQ
jgi:hypothetical protein